MIELIISLAGILIAFVSGRYIYKEIKSGEAPQLTLSSAPLRDSENVIESGRDVSLLMQKSDHSISDRNIDPHLLNRITADSEDIQNPEDILIENKDALLLIQKPDHLISNQVTDFRPPEQIKTEIFYKLFPNLRVIIDSERKTGFSHSMVYIVNRYDDKKAKKPAIVKVAPSYIIRREQEAYDKYIKENLPLAVTLNNAVYTADKRWGALHYVLAGDGLYSFISLHEHLLLEKTTRNSTEETIKGLIKCMEKLWNAYNTYEGFSFWNSYDRVLPVNLIIKAENIAAPTTKPIILSAYTVGSESVNLSLDKFVSLVGFEVVDTAPHEGDSPKKEYTLNIPMSENDDQPNSYRIRLICEKPGPSYSAGQKPRITGRVINTRAILLETAARKAFGHQAGEFDIDAPFITLNIQGQIIDLPNPLRALDTILKRPLNVRVATIHGDLQVENIRVGPGTCNFNLIDFADARNDHVLHDLLRLETSLVTKWLSKTLHENNLPPTTIYSFYNQLHRSHFVPKLMRGIKSPPLLTKPFVALQIIRRTAGNYLFDHNDYRDYYDGLTIYLLGVLKFKELDPFTHQVAFWGAATSQYLSTKKATDHSKIF